MIMEDTIVRKPSTNYKMEERYHKSKEEKWEYREDNKEQIKGYGWNCYKSISKEGKKRKQMMEVITKSLWKSFRESKTKKKGHCQD